MKRLILAGWLLLLPGCAMDRQIAAESEACASGDQNACALYALDRQQQQQAAMMMMQEGAYLSTPPVNRYGLAAPGY